MMEEHILDILDEKAFGELKEAELSFIKSHAARCETCFRAFEAARISSTLLKIHAAAAAAETAAPSPFFQTRVMANLRERQARVNPFAAFGKLWRASASLMVMLVSIVFGLIALTVFAPDYNTVSSASVSSLENDSTDMVIVNGRLIGREPNDEQVFQIIYEPQQDNNSRK
jgi:hypothetical protein